MSFQSQLLADNPVFLLRLSEPSGNNTALDSSPNLLNGTYVGCSREVPVTGISSNLGISMGGTPSDYVSIPHNALLSPTGDFAVGCVFKTSIAQTSKRLITKYSGASTSFILGFSASNGGRLRWMVNIGGTQYQINTTLEYSDGSPHLVVGVRRGTSLEIWVDGILDTSGSCPSGLVVTNTAAVTLGTNAGSLDDNYNGSLDEAFMLPVAPSGDRIGAYHDGLFFPTILSGNAKLDTGAKADRVLVRSWGDFTHIREILPDVDGNWSTNLPPGDYEVTVRGPTGYQPVTHGPVTTVEE